ncbi:MAG: amino acid ABC transporter ATP-binding protein [Erysipelotrichaceae bacterium]|nr:amino acid ABC transporter ATP-binding protein [Erysipelotrichaceae bacterium]
MISLTNVSKVFDKTTVLKEVTIEFEPEKTYAIIGSSGAGKSTLLRCINLLEIPSSGSVVVDGVNLVLDKKKLSLVREKIGMVFQNFNLFAHMSALHNVMFALVKVKKMNDADAQKEAVKYLTEVGLQYRLNNYPHQLSGGEKQRVAIARALAMKPKVMLFDEPTSALDPEMTQEVLKVIKQLNHIGMTNIIVTHEIKFAQEVADYIIFMDNAEILEVTPTQIFFSKPKSSRAVEFLSNMI